MIINYIINIQFFTYNIINSFEKRFKMHYPFTPIELPYPLNALEPFISSETLYYHYNKHYMSYVNSLNNNLAKFPSLQNLSLEELIVYLSNSNNSYKCELLNSAGGVYNHQLYFKCMTPDTCSAPKNELLYAIKRDFGSYNNFVDCFTNKSKSLIGSGYIWLTFHNCKLELFCSTNQNTPLSHYATPLLNIDLWEHSYYLQYKNNREEYINNWFNIINWNYVYNRFISIT